MSQIVIDDAEEEIACIGVAVVAEIDRLVEEKRLELTGRYRRSYPRLGDDEIQNIVRSDLWKQRKNIRAQAIKAKVPEDCKHPAKAHLIHQIIKDKYTKRDSPDKPAPVEQFMPGEQMTFESILKQADRSRKI